MDGCRQQRSAWLSLVYRGIGVTIRAVISCNVHTDMCSNERDEARVIMIRKKRKEAWVIMDPICALDSSAFVASAVKFGQRSTGAGPATPKQGHHPSPAVPVPVSVQVPAPRKKVALQQAGRHGWKGKQSDPPRLSSAMHAHADQKGKPLDGQAQTPRAREAAGDD
jgi:hypothetical protein